MNQVTLIGRISKDLELRDSSTGGKFCAFTLAVSEYRNSNEFTNFIPCMSYDKQAENMCKFLRKGSLIAVSGRISVRSKNENGKYTTIVNVQTDRVDFLESKSSNTNRNENEYVKVEQSNSNYDVNQVNSFEPTNNIEKTSDINEDKIILSDNDSILWD